MATATDLGRSPLKTKLSVFDDSEEIDMGEEIQNLNREFEKTMDGLDEKLKRVIKNHEHDYLKGYQIYVREKEQELRNLVGKLNERDEASAIKAEIIRGLKDQLKH